MREHICGERFWSQRSRTRLRLHERRGAPYVPVARLLEVQDETIGATLKKYERDQELGEVVNELTELYFKQYPRSFDAPWPSTEHRDHDVLLRAGRRACPAGAGGACASGRVHLLRFERLLGCDATALEKLLAFAGLEASAAALGGRAECAFAALRREGGRAGGFARRVEERTSVTAAVAYADRPASKRAAWEMVKDVAGA